jgi:hypothetical protein
MIGFFTQERKAKVGGSIGSPLEEKIHHRDAKYTKIC